MNEALTVVWGVLNTPVGIAALAAVTLWLLNRAYAARPVWARFEGTLITAVKLAEKAIPNDAPSAGLRRLDEALRYVLKVFEEVEGRRATAAERAALKEAVQVAHAELEAAGTL